MLSRGLPQHLCALTPRRSYPEMPLAKRKPARSGLTLLRAGEGARHKAVTGSTNGSRIYRGVNGLRALIPRIATRVRIRVTAPFCPGIVRAVCFTHSLVLPALQSSHEHFSSIPTGHAPVGSVSLFLRKTDMSQHLLDTSIADTLRPVRIVMGFDEASGGAFATVAGTDDNVFYASRLGQPLDLILGRMEALGILIPEEMVRAVEMDIAFQDHGHVSTWTRDGRQLH